MNVSSKTALSALWAELQKETGLWSDETFPLSSNSSRIAHMEDELKELLDKPADKLEMADIMLLLMHHAHIHKVNLVDAVAEKFEIIKQRKWGKPDERGVVRHV